MRRIHRPLAADKTTQTAQAVAEPGERLLAGQSPLPLYHRLHLLLRERILNGTYAPGEVLPAEAELMKAFGVSRITVQRAINNLADEGLVTRARGRGTTVTADAASLKVGNPIAASIQGLLVNLSNIGQGTSVNVIEFMYGPAPVAAAQALGLKPGTRIQQATRIRKLRGEPFSKSVSHVIESVGQTFDQSDLEQHPLIDLLHRAGVRIARVEQSITSCLADDRSAALLDVHVGAPLLKLSRVFIDDAGRKVNYAEVFYRPDRFEYRVTWTRDQDNQMQIDVPLPLIG